MDITSYLLGKQAGGGSTTNLQNNKNITITSNGTEEVNPDTGYDGMKKITVSTNITPNLETKSVTITENKTTTITPTSGKDGISSIEVTTLVPTGGEPEKGFFATEWDSNGMATKYKVKNMQLISNMFNGGYNSLNGYIQEIVIEPVNETITEIPSNFAQEASQLTTINLPNTLTTIQSSAFSKCVNLVLTELPNGLNKIYTGAFFNCYKVEINKIPDGVTSIPTNGFGNCRALKKISMLSTIYIESTAFTGCTALKKVWIGSAITSAGFNRYAFNNCTALETMYIDLPRATVESFTNYPYAFMNDTSKTGIIVCNDDAGFISKAEFDALVVE